MPIDLSRSRPEDRCRALLDLVQRVTATVLDYDSPADIDPDRAFGEQGVDSLGAVEMRELLSAAIGMSLASTLIFEQPTPVAVARYLDELLHGQPTATNPLPDEPPGRDEDPIVIVGMACRFPGDVGSPDELWTILTEERDGITPFPDDRGWDIDAHFDPEPSRPGTTYVRHGGFLADANGFDAAFFGISPREALAMDPQQRQLLEVSWEALERAGIDPTTLRGSNTGVYVGTFVSQYAAVLAPVYDQVEGYFGTGTTIGVAAGRVAYVLGLEGPTMTVDTACSSSLVSLHLAAQALRAGECDLALAGGVSTISDLTVYTELCRERALSADGRCRSFADDAGGFGPAEGIGMLLVQRMSDARRDGRTILAVIRGSAVNQDGASNGLTAPSGAAQQRVIRRALTVAGLGAEDVDVVEAHGTGTPLGDPIEARAVLATYGQRAPKQPVLLGSVKSNLGHTQGAAGVAGVIKMVLAMQHGVVPRSLHSEVPSSRVDWSSGAVRLVNRTMGWPATERPRRSGVSAFGISGTNAHLILEQAPELVERQTSISGTPNDTLVPWAFSARTPDALRAYASGLLAHASSNEDLAATGRALIESRTAFEHRAVVFGTNREDLVAGLTAVSTATTSPHAVTGADRSGAGVVLVFPGQGSQWPGMGRNLLAGSPVFAQWIAECERAFAPYVDWKLTDVLRSDAELSTVDIVQPALFAVLVGIARLWEYHGVHADAVLGHSQGEIAAAYVAGALSLDDAARIVTSRSQALARIAGSGGMAAVMLDRAETEQRLQAYAGAITVAAANGPSSTVVSGDATAVTDLVARLDDEGVWARRIGVDYASHSAQVEAVHEELHTNLAAVRGLPGHALFCSTVTGDVLNTEGLNADYWYQNLRCTVEFERATRALLNRGYRVFIEASPHPVLTTALAQTTDIAAVLPSLHRNRSTVTDFTTQVATAYANGVSVDWDRLLPPTNRPHPPLPTYPFQHRTYWPEPSTNHGLLGRPVQHAGTLDTVFNGTVGIDSHSWLADHAIGGTVLFPGTGFLDIALQAAKECGQHSVAELAIEAPLVLAESGCHELQVIVGGTAPTVDIYARPGDTAPEGPWTRHATGTLTSESTGSEPDTLVAWPPCGVQPLDLSGFYQRASASRYEYGPTFQGLRAAWRSGDVIYAEVALRDVPPGTVNRHAVHPALLDATLHPLALTNTDGQDPKLPFLWSGVRLITSGATTLRVRLTPTGPDAVSLLATDTRGRPVLVADQLLVRPVSVEQLRQSVGADTPLMRVDWRPMPPLTPRPRAHLVTVGPDQLELASLRAAVDIGTATPDAIILRIRDLGDNPAASAQQAAVAVHAALREWLHTDYLTGTRLVVVTHQSLATGPNDPITGLGHASVPGLVRSAQAEFPDRNLLLIDGDDSVDVLLPAIWHSDERSLAVRAGRVLVPRLVPAASGSQDPPLDPEGTVLVTGGLGTLGGLAARHLVEHYRVRRLLLISRRGPDHYAATTLQEQLTAAGAEVTVAACDVADRKDLARLLARVPSTHPLTGVVHAAGVLDDGVLDALDADRFARVMAAKVHGAWNLHELVGDVSLFLLFSSASGVAGSPGQANYAAANTFLDALAQYRRARGLAGQSLAWGLWAAASAMTGHLTDADRDRMRRSGVLSMSVEEGLTRLDGALATDHALLVAGRFDRDEPGRAPLLRDTARRFGTERAAGPEIEPSVALADVPAPERPDAATTMVRSAVAHVLGYTRVDDVPVGRRLRDLGVDSLTAMELRNRLQNMSGLSLSAAVVFDHPTIDELAAHLLAKLGPTTPTAVSQQAAEPHADLPSWSTDEELFAFVDRALAPRSQDSVHDN